MIINVDEVWMISLLDDPRTQAVRDFTVPMWEDQGFKVNLFNAITPKTISSVVPQLTFGMKTLRNHHLSTPFSGGEIACAYSHFCLWKQCFTENKSYMIVEEDIYPICEVPKVWDIQRICSLVQNKSPSWGYVTLPIKAKAMWEDAQTKLWKQQVDGFVASHIENIPKGASSGDYIIPSDNPKKDFIAEYKRVSSCR